MFEIIKELNPKLRIQMIDDKTFCQYGRIIENDVKDILHYGDVYITPPKSGNEYLASVKDVEDLTSIQTISKKVYGYMEVEAGTCTGQNTTLSGIEYHQGSETIIAITDYVLIVGKMQDMEYSYYDSSSCECFYVPRGTIVECYSTTLHYTPCKVEEAGFKTIVLLLKGTGDSIDEYEGILKKKNKWFIAHTSNIEKIDAGDFPGLKGPLLQVKYKK